MAVVVGTGFWTQAATQRRFQVSLERLLALMAVTGAAIAISGSSSFPMVIKIGVFWYAFWAGVVCCGGVEYLKSRLISRKQQPSG